VRSAAREPSRPRPEVSPRRPERSTSLSSAWGGGLSNDFELFGRRKGHLRRCADSARSHKRRGRVPCDGSRVDRDRVARIATTGVAGVDGVTSQTSVLRLRVLTTPAAQDEAVVRLTTHRIDVIGYASTSSASAIGFDDEGASSRLARRTGVPVVATFASAELALRLLNVGRLALIHPPWFDVGLLKSEAGTETERPHTGCRRRKLASTSPIYSPPPEPPRRPQRPG
jgi:hypothetical protein